MAHNSLLQQIYIHFGMSTCLPTLYHQRVYGTYIWLAFEVKIWIFRFSRTLSNPCKYIYSWLLFYAFKTRVSVITDFCNCSQYLIKSKLLLCWWFFITFKFYNPAKYRYGRIYCSVFCFFPTDYMRFVKIFAIFVHLDCFSKPDLVHGFQISSSLFSSFVLLRGLVRNSNKHLSPRFVAFI